MSVSDNDMTRWCGHLVAGQLLSTVILTFHSAIFTKKIDSILRIDLVYWTLHKIDLFASFESFYHFTKIAILNPQFLGSVADKTGLSGSLINNNNETHFLKQLIVIVMTYNQLSEATH